MRRLAVIIGGLAFFWACAVTLHVLVASSPTGITTLAVIAGSSGDVPSVAPPLASADGVWVTGLLLVISMLSGVPMGVALTHPPVQRVTAWTVGSMLLGFCLLAGLAIGLPYLPSAILVLGMGAMANMEPRLNVLGASRS